MTVITMKVSKAWLEELVEIKDIKEVERLLPLRTIALREVTEDYIELDMKGYNRSDLLSMRGVAYEVAAIADSKVKFEEPKDGDYVWSNNQLPPTPITTDEKINPIQAVAKIEGLKVKKSPEEWVKKLNDSGMRGVNNIVDITNLVMLEYGHPLHAFDAETVKDDTINVRRAKDGEEIKTLDGKLRKLSTDDMVLADNEKALDIAGIMGGKDTEIKDSTTTILLSASFFDPNMIRQTAKKLGLGTESTKRFYHGLTRKRLLQAFDAAIRMYEEMGGKLTALTIVGDTKDPVRKVPLTIEKTSSLIGVNLSEDQVENYLEKLGFELENDGNSWIVTPSYYRLDIEIEEDLIEEVARMYGYEKIPSKELEKNLPAGRQVDQKLFELIYNLKKTLADLGLTEVQTYSFFSSLTLDILGWMEGDNRKYLVKVENPISSETEYMRQNIWPNLVEVIDKNIRQGYKDIAIFEIGKAYFMHGEEIKEQYRLSIALMNGTDNPLAELNQIVKQLAEKLEIKIKVAEGKQDGPLGPLFHPNRYLDLEINGTKVGSMTEVHPRILDQYGVQKRVAVLEVTLESLV